MPDFIVTEDVTGVNAGMFFFYKSEWSRMFLDHWWNATSFIRPLKQSKSGDNDALKYLIKTMVHDYGWAKMANEVVHVLDVMEELGCMPTIKVYNEILNILVRHDFYVAKHFFLNTMMSSGIKPIVYTFGILIKALCLLDRIWEAFRLLESMRHQGCEPNEVTYHTLISGFFRLEEVREALELLESGDARG